MSGKSFYLTTPLYYVNDIPHIGHAYTTVAADVLARYMRLEGADVFFLTGTDEHGEKIWRAAEREGEDTQKFVNGMAEGFKQAWKTLEITYDDFIRTTDKKHVAIVQKVFQTLQKNGDIYKGEYEGWYCVPCESFWNEGELRDGNLCPDCGRPTEIVKEESYFFKLSKYQDGILKHIESKPDFIHPASRRNEVLQFIKQGLRDISITRTAFPWGVAVPDDPKHVIYVWFDALINYISALGYPDGEKFKQYWPADVHLMGKEIVRFHAVTWPAMLLALNLPLPKKIFGHGWWTVEGQKMSKSKGNVVDPLALSKEYGVDVVRYFLMREVAFGDDGNFSMQSFINRYNADLANDLGNLLNRTLNMVEKYFNGVIPDPKGLKSFNEESSRLIFDKDLINKNQENRFSELSLSLFLIDVWSYITRANVYIENQAPWKLAKSGETDKLAAIMHNLCFTLSAIAYFIVPFMPSTAQKIWIQLGLDGEPSEEIKIVGVKIAKGEPLFPRIQK
jgi:methionyl-tRNA synthetase